MCLGVPGRVVEIHDDPDGVRMGKVDFDGIRKDVCLAYLPDLAVGDYTIVHVGFAITKLDEASALESLRMFRELGLLDEELGQGDPAEATPPACPVPDWQAPPPA
jgi:hydrogenase expression/formation protein HypC